MLSLSLQGDSLGVSKKIEAAKVVDLGPRTFQKFGAVNNERKALRAAHRDIEAVSVK